MPEGWETGPPAVFLGTRMGLYFASGVGCVQALWPVPVWPRDGTWLTRFRKEMTPAALLGCGCHPVHSKPTECIA